MSFRGTIASATPRYVRAHATPRPRGAALILAMLIAALAATVAVALAAEQQRWFTDVGNRRDQVQAQSLALAGVQWARQILQDDGRGSTLDHLGEPWALPLPATPIANGVIEGRIEDAQARFNLNNLAVDAALGATERARLARVFAARGVPAAALEAIADWVDADAAPRAGGAEDAAYAQLNVPTLAANAPLVRAAEIAGVRGVGDGAVMGLLPFVAALPAGTALNVNTASAEILAAALPDLSGDPLATLLAERARKPFSTIAEFRARLPRGVAIGDETAFTVSSSYFLVSVRSRQGEAVALARALLKREGSAWPTVVWQTLE
jgi:general secretion pathway protein K